MLFFLHLILNSIEPRISITLISNDFMGFFDNKIALIRETILQLTDSCSTPGTIEIVARPDIYLDDLSQIITSSSKLSIYILEPT